MPSESVCMFVYNSFVHDARVLKEAQTLVNGGYQVTVVALLGDGLPDEEFIDGIHILRVPKNPVHLRLIQFLRCDFCRLHFFPYLKRSIGDPLLSLRANPRHTKLLSYDDVNQSMRGDAYPRLKSNQYVQNIRAIFYGVRRKAGRILIGGKRAIARLLIAGNRAIARVAITGVRMCVMPFHRQLCFLDYYLRTDKRLAGEAFSIYHAHDLNTLPLAWRLARRHHGCLVYDSHEYYLERNRAVKYTFFGRWWRKKLEGYLVRSADLNITVNESIATMLGERYGVNPFKVIMNAPARRDVVVGDQECDLHNVLGICRTNKILLYLGAITFNRGLERVIESLQYLPECHLVMMGFGKDDYKQGLLAEAEHFSVRDRLHFFGPVPSEMVTSYACSADVGVAAIKNVCLSYYYCSPNKVFEYVLSGLPVAASDFPELRKVVCDYNVGLTFNPEDPKDIAETIREILGSPEIRNNLRANGLLAAEAFNWEKESKKLLSNYRALGTH